MIRDGEAMAVEIVCHFMMKVMMLMSPWAMQRTV